MKPLALLLPLLMIAGCVTTTNGGNGETNLDEAARTNTTLAVEYARKGNYDMALEKAKRALSQDDSYAPAHSTIALIYAQRGDDVEAVKHYRRAISLDSKDLFTRNNFAIFECERGRTDEALELFESVARNKSYNSPDAALINAGVCANRANRNDKAESYFREALAIQPDNPEALLQLATLAKKKKDWLKVRAFIQRRDRAVKPTVESLRLAIEAERELGDTAAAERLNLQLQRETH
ncbi:MAG: type IV pilus biogenesis/stability protein PilW [Pseudomonadota bacterium]